jgi:hypothetical protein
LCLLCPVPWLRPGPQQSAGALICAADSLRPPRAIKWHPGHGITSKHQQRAGMLRPSFQRVGKLMMTGVLQQDEAKLRSLAAHMDAMSIGARDRPAVLHGVPRPQGTHTIFRDGASPLVLRAEAVAAAEADAERLVDAQAAALADAKRRGDGETPQPQKEEEEEPRLEQVAGGAGAVSGGEEDSDAVVMVRVRACGLRYCYARLRRELAVSVNGGKWRY